MPTCFLIGSGTSDSLSYYQRLLPLCEVVIGVDGGTNLLHEMNKKPDWVLGDNDSISDSTLRWLSENGIQPTVYPREKDKSDFELAADRIIRDYSGGVLYLAAMLGGRIDHTLINIDIARRLLQKGFHPVFISEKTWIRLVCGPEIIRGQGTKGSLLSLVPLSDFVWIKQTIYLQYSLLDERVDKMSSRGLSNILLADRFGMDVAEGEALLIYQSESQFVSPLLFQQGGKE